VCARVGVFVGVHVDSTASVSVLVCVGQCGCICESELQDTLNRSALLAFIMTGQH